MTLPEMEEATAQAQARHRALDEAREREIAEADRRREKEAAATFGEALRQIQDAREAARRREVETQAVREIIRGLKRAGAPSDAVAALAAWAERNASPSPAPETPAPANARSSSIPCPVCRTPLPLPNRNHFLVCQACVHRAVADYDRLPAAEKERRRKLAVEACTAVDCGTPRPPAPAEAPCYILSHTDAEAKRNGPRTTWAWREGAGLLVDLELLLAEHREALIPLRTGDWDVARLRRARQSAESIADAYDHLVRRMERLANEQRCKTEEAGTA